MLDREPQETLSLEYERERRLLERVPERRRARGCGALALAADQFIIAPKRPAGTPRGRERRARTCARVIAGYHWFTDWGRDTMISLEGLTLCTGRHARGGGDPAHVPAPREATGSCRTSSPRARTRACTTRPTRRCGSSTPSTATSSTRRTRSCCGLLPDAREHRRPPPARHPLRHPRGPGGRAAEPGAGGLPAHVDGREGGRLGGDAAAGQGGGDQRAVVQRAEADGGVGRDGWATDGGALRARRRRRRTRVFNRALLERGEGCLTTWWTARTGDDPAVPARTRCSPSR